MTNRGWRDWRPGPGIRRGPIRRSSHGPALGLALTACIVTAGYSTRASTLGSVCRDLSQPVGSESPSVAGQDRSELRSTGRLM